MNILFLTRQMPYPPHDGGKIRTFHLMKGLVLNNKLTLVCSKNGSFDDEAFEFFKEQGISLVMVSEKRLESRWKMPLFAFLSLFSLTPFVIRRRFSPAIKKKIKEILENNNIDLIFCDSLYQAIHIPRKAKNKVLCEQNIESVIIQRYLKTERNIFKRLFGFIEFLKMQRFENKMWKVFNHCFVVSRKDKEIVGARVKRKNIEVVPNGIDINYYYPRDVKMRQFSLVYTGQMGWTPNEDAVVHFLKDIYPIIKRQIPQVSFWVVGKNPSKRIKGFASLDSSVIVTGYVNDVRPYIAEAEVVVAPLRIGSGTRLKILEAMAMGKPVISTRIGAEGLDVTNGENILIADKPEDFARKVADLFENPSQAKRLSSAGRVLVEEKYSWDKIIEKLVAFVEDLKAVSDD